MRLGALFGGPLLAAVLLAHRPLPIGAAGTTASGQGLAPPLRRVPAWFYAAVLVVTLIGSLYWQFTASVTQIARAVGDPSTEASYFQPAAHWLMEHGGRGTRIEVPPTAEPLGVGLPGAEVRPRPRLAAPARHRPRRPLLPGRSPHPSAATGTGCAATRSPTSPSPMRRSITPR